MKNKNILVKSEKNRCQILHLTCDRGKVSVSNTADNGWETAVEIDGKWYIKIGNFSSALAGVKTLDEALEIIKSIDAPMSHRSDDEYL